MDGLNVQWPMMKSYSTMGLPVKSFKIDFSERTSKRYEVTLTGLKECVNNYGVRESITPQSEECDEEHLSQTILDLLKRSPVLWEDTIIHVTQL